MKGDQIFYEYWPETLALIFFLIALASAAVSGNFVMNYVLTIVAGLFAGRILYIKHRTQPIFPFVLVIVGFAVGFFIGSFFASRLMVLVIFVASVYVSYKLHAEGYIGFYKSKRFIR